MQTFLSALSVPIARKDGHTLARLLISDRETNPAAKRLVETVGNCDRKSLEVYKGSIAAPWDEISIALIQVVTHVMDDNYSEAYREQAHLVNQFFRFFILQTTWILPTLDTLLQRLRYLAARADLEARHRDEKSDVLEDAARICNKAFTNCLTDRSPLMVNGVKTSRKWGAYRAVGVTLKSYIKADKLGLHKALLRSLTVQSDMPAFEKFPKPDQVTCKYYFGLIAFLNEDWAKAYEEFTFAFTWCLRTATRNQELILTYLIPLQLLRGRLPTQALLENFPRLKELYTPFIAAIRRGDVQKFDTALQWAEVRLIEQNVWIAVEKVREVCLRGLLKRVWKVSNKTTRLPIATIRQALKISNAMGPDLDAMDTDGDEKEKEKMALDEAECITATMIFQGYIRGYISHEKRMVVLAAKDTFPSLANRTVK